MLLLKKELRFAINTEFSQLNSKEIILRKNMVVLEGVIFVVIIIFKLVTVFAAFGKEKKIEKKGCVNLYGTTS